MREILFVLVMTFGVFIQALAGFGGPLIAMPLGIVLMGIQPTKPVMTIVAWITGAVVLVTDYRYINRRELAKMVGVMLIGVLGGIWLADTVKLQFLLILYALVVAGIGVKRLFFPKGKPVRTAIKNLALAIAGVMQGLFVSGGSFLAVYSVEQLPEKREFRATVNAVWAIINIIMIATYGIGGQLTREVWIFSAILLVPTLLMIWLGKVLCKYVKQETFMKMVYVLLIVSGLVLLITNL